MRPLGYKYPRDPRRHVRPRIPLAYASLLIIALVAVIGFAAFSPSPSQPEEAVAPTTIAAAPLASARVASAVLAVRVADANSRVATTEPAPTTTEGAPSTTTEEVAADTTQTTSAPDTTTTTKPRDTTPPPLRVTSHKDGDTVDSTYITFKGTSEPGAYVRSGPFDATTDDDGSWSLGLAMADGDNRAIFTAIDTAGNTTEIKITVTYNKPQATTTTRVTTTTHAPHSTTTAPPAQSNWSPLWPADGGGVRNVEAWRPLVEQYWAADRVDCVLGIIKKESRGDPRAYNSSSGAEGLMQHLSKYWKGRAAAAGFRDSNGLYATPYNAEANIAAGAYIAGSASDWYTPWSYHPAYGSCPDSRG